MWISQSRYVQLDNMVSQAEQDWWEWNHGYGVYVRQAPKKEWILSWLFLCHLKIMESLLGYSRCIGVEGGHCIKSISSPERNQYRRLYKWKLHIYALKTISTKFRYCDIYWQSCETYIKPQSIPFGVVCLSLSLPLSLCEFLTHYVILCYLQTSCLLSLLCFWFCIYDFTLIPRIGFVFSFYF